MYLLVLVYTHEIEPIVLLHTWLKEFDLAISKSPKQSLIPDITHAVQSKLCISFLEQNRLYLYVVGFWGSPIIVDQSRYL